MEAYAAYSDPSNSGFSFIFDTKSMVQGNNTIKLVMTGKDGTLKSETITLVSNEFYVEKAYSETLTYYAKAELSKGSAIKQVDGKWIAATEEDIRYYIDPANFMNDYIGKYMFMKLSYIEVDNAVLEQMLAGKGILSGKAQVFKDACIANNINPIYVIAHALLETGNGTSVLANGVLVKEKHVVFNDLYSPVIPVDPPVTVYNMFGIGAYDGNAVLWGSERALDKGWTTPDLAIAGGVKFLAESYINNATYMQNTLYTMRYRFEGYGLWHQYSTDIAWHYKQARIIQREFAKIPNLPRFEFEIPTFKEELPQQ
jgi:beta-N-acetylglucosaminidase